MKTIQLTVLLLLFSFLITAQEHTITYTVKDAVTSEPISDCTISYFDGSQNRYLVTSTDGKFVISTNQNQTVSFSHIAYEAKAVLLSDVKNQTIYLTAKYVQLDGVTVYSAYSPTNKGSSYKYNALQAGSSISVIGEPDILRHISSLPGVSQGIESSLGLFVRGGNNGSNGLYFNDVPMYVSSHLMGMFSVFPADMVNEATFYMGGLPALKGNQSSSLLDVSVKRQYGNKFNGKFTLSPYLSGIYTSVPLIKDKLSVQFSGRTSFAPYIVNLFNKTDEKMDIQVYDITTTVDYKASDKHYFDGMFFATNDFFGYTQNGSQSAQNWRSVIGKLGWRSVWNERLNLNVWTYYTSTYSAQRDIKFDDTNKTRKSQLGVSSELDEWALNAKLNYSISDKLLINGGATFQKQVFKPGNEKYVVSHSDVHHTEIQPNNLLSFFGETAYNPNKYINLRLGYRHTFQKTKSDNFSNFDVHFLSHIFLTDSWGVELTFDRLNQYYHILEGLPTGWSMNIMTPGSKEFPAELTHQYYSGVFWKKDLNKTKLNLSLGGYYRDMQNIVTYKNAINAFGFNSNSWKEEIDLGKGKSYGLEMSGSLQGERFGSTLAYTLSKTDRIFPNVNNGAPFPFKFDRRHILNLQTKFTVSKYKNRRGKDIEHVLNSVVAYSSGNRATLAVGSYPGEAPPYWGQLMSGQSFPAEFFNNIYDRQLMSQKNGFIMKDYFRIDLAYTLKRVSAKTTNEFSFSVFNVLNRHNPYTYFRENNQWKQLSIVPIMPSVRWTVSW